jgi:hypothetical protein
MNGYPDSTVVEAEGLAPWSALMSTTAEQVLHFLLVSLATSSSPTVIESSRAVVYSSTGDGAMKKPGAESEEQKRSASAWMFQLAMCFHAALLTMLELALLVMKAGPQNLVL